MIAATSPDAGLLSACVTFQAAWQAERAAYGPVDLPEHLTKATSAAAEIVQGLTPTTFQGMREKARVGYVMVCERLFGSRHLPEGLTREEALAIDFLRDLAGEYRA